MIIILTAGTAAAFAEEPAAEESVAEEPVAEEPAAVFSVNRLADEAAAALLKASAKSIMDPQSPFRDTKGHWGESYIAKAVSRGLFSGYDENRFGPDDPVNRGQFVTVLYRQAESPEPSAEAPFNDISGQIEEFRKAIAWGVENQYVNGTGPARFEPNTKLSRQQAMKILYSYSGGMKGMESLFTATYDKYFADVNKIDDWGKVPMYWGVYNGLVSASSDKKLKPRENVTRAQLSKILVTYAEDFNSVGLPDTAGETTESPGIYNLKAEKRIAHLLTLKARTAEGKWIGDKIIEIDGRKVTLFKNAKRIEMWFSGAEDGRYYLATLQKDSDVVPSIETILSMDQAAAEGDTVKFMLYPGYLEPGSNYSIYMAYPAEEGYTPLEKVASFRCYAPPEE